MSPPGSQAHLHPSLTDHIALLPQFGEPTQKVLVYDLGFSQEQLASMLCWLNVDVRRFRYEDYPPHVLDVRNYAFKALILAEALKEAPAVLWIDSGLELRAPMDT